MNLAIAKAQLQLLQVRHQFSARPVLVNASQQDQSVGLDDGALIDDDAHSQHWVTISGARVLIDGDGNVIGGAGGSLNGKTFADAVRGADITGTHKHDDLLTAIAKNGGLSRKEAISQGIDPAMLSYKTAGGHRLFNNGSKAMSYDAAHEIIDQHGYGIHDANDMVDKVHNAVNHGMHVYTPEGWNHHAGQAHNGGYDHDHEQRKSSVMQAAQDYDLNNGTNYAQALQSLDSQGKLDGDELTAWEEDLGLGYDLFDDADRWITVHPNGDDSTGQPVLIGEDGTVKGGMGGKFNGKDIKDAHGTKEFTSHETNAETEKRNTKKTESPTEPVTVSPRTEGVGHKIPKNPLTEPENGNTMLPNSTETKGNNMNTPTDPVTVSPATEGVTHAIPSAPVNLTPKEKKAHDLLNQNDNKFKARIESNQTVVDFDSVNRSQENVLKTLGFKPNYDNRQWVNTLNGAKKISEYEAEIAQKEKRNAEFEEEQRQRISRINEKKLAENNEKDAAIAKELETTPIPKAQPTESVKKAVSSYKSVKNAVNALHHVATNSDWYKSIQDDSYTLAEANNSLHYLKQAIKDSGVSAPETDIVAYVDFINKSSSTEISKDYEGLTLDTPYKFFRALYDKDIPDQITTNMTGGSEKQNKYANDIVKQKLFDMVMSGKTKIDIEKEKHRLLRHTPKNIIEFKNHLSQLPDSLAKK